MVLRKSNDLPSSAITPEEVFRSRNRRQFMTGAVALAASAAMPRGLLADTPKLQSTPGKYTVPDTQTPASKATTYNNFYEFGEDKSEPARNAHTLQTRPWTVEVSGMVAKPLTVDVDSLMHYRPLESRVYRHRCVERWSMVIPWDGYSLSELIKFCQPLPSAKYVQFLSKLDKKQMPDLPGGFDWPYSEGLRLDEAMNPLALLAFGCYGNVLPNQNGAPVRVVLPWKYGFKSAKSIVKLHFTDKQPRTLWNEANPPAYGFYSNVNPSIDTPWSQASERRLDASTFPRTIATLPFNGYADQVASMYSGMDLQKYY